MYLVTSCFLLQVTDRDKKQANSKETFQRCSIFSFILYYSPSDSYFPKQTTVGEANSKAFLKSMLTTFEI